MKNLLENIWIIMNKITFPICNYNIYNKLINKSSNIIIYNNNKLWMKIINQFKFI